MRTLSMLFIAALLFTSLEGCQRKTEQEQGATNAADLYARAEEIYLAGRHDEALALLREIPAGTPESARAHNLMGLIHAKRGNMALATLEFKEALTANPNMAQAHNNLGMIYLQEGQLEMAQASFTAAINADRYYAAPHQGLAEVYYKMGRMEDARTELTLANELRSTQAAGAAASLQDLEIGQRLDVAQLMQQEQERPAAARPSAPRTAARPKTPKPATAKPQEADSRKVTERVVAATGTTFKIALDQPVSSGTAEVGQEVAAHVVGNVTVGENTLIRSGAPVKGKVTQVERSGRVKGRATLALAFDSVETTAGWRDIQAHMVEGSFKAPGTKKKDAAKIGIGAAAGAVLGEIIGDKPGLGAVIGGAAGTAVVLSTKGKEVEIEPGTEVALELDQPLAVNVTKETPVTE